METSPIAFLTCSLAKSRVSSCKSEASEANRNLPSTNLDRRYLKLRNVLNLRINHLLVKKL